MFKSKRTKIRVIHIVYSFGTGGLEKGIATLVRNASECFEHIVLCLHSSGETAQFLPAGTSVIELHKPSGNSLSFVWKLRRTIERLKPAIVHARNWGGTDGIIAARLAGVRAAIQGEHGWLIDDPEGMNVKRLRLRRIFDYWTQEYTCVSQHLSQWLVKTVKVKRPVTQIYNGVDIQVFSPGERGKSVRAELGLSDKSFIIGMVGRLDPIKDHPTLFRAYQTLKREYADIHLIIVGKGPERQRLERLAGSDILFLGNRQDIPAILQATDVFALPSLNEGISNTILEAMAVGLPVITTNVGGNPELARDGKTGMLVPPAEPMAICAALRNYIRNPELARIHGDAGRKIVVEQFSVEQMVQGYERVYKRIALNTGIIKSP